MPVTWTTADDRAAALGNPSDDPDGLALANDAANDWCYRRRQKAGYTDDPDEVPDAAVKQAVILYGVTLYRERGAADTFTSFEDFAPTTPVGWGGMGQVNRLLGVNRPQVDRLPP